MCSSPRSSRPGNSSPRRCMSTKIQSIRYSSTEAKERYHVRVYYLPIVNMLGERLFMEAWCSEMHVSGQQHTQFYNFHFVQLSSDTRQMMMLVTTFRIVWKHPESQKLENHSRRYGHATSKCQC